MAFYHTLLLEIETCIGYKPTHNFPQTLSGMQPTSSACPMWMQIASRMATVFEGLGNFQSVGSTPCDVVHLRHSWAKSKRPRLIAWCLVRTGLAKEEDLQQADLFQEHVGTLLTQSYFFKNMQHMYVGEEF